MARRNLFAKLNNPSSSIPLRPFDLSQRKVFSARAGMCIPTLALTCVKGDKFKIDSTIFNRTDRLLAPSFFRCKQFHHFFFIPYHTLWHEWDAFYTRSTEKLSSATLGSEYFPNFDINAFINEVSKYGGPTYTDFMGYQQEPGIDRILQMLHYGSTNGWDSQGYEALSPTPVNYMNLARILAYNKIWYWYYRDKRHSSNRFDDFVKMYNVDDINASTFANSHIAVSGTGLTRLFKMFMPKYRTWDSDLFTNSFASTQFGSVSVVNADSVVLQSKVASSDISSYPNSKVGLSTISTTPVMVIRDGSNNIINGSSSWDIPSLFDILSLRRAEAIQHWRELMLRAGDSSKDRYRAMFGTNPKRSEEIPNYVGGFDVNLNIDDVTSTAGTGQDGSLGDLAGKGLMYKDDKSIKFTSPDFGILMCITSILPLSEYDGDCFDRDNQLIEPTDFYIPQFDRLGFEPVTLAEWDTKPTWDNGWATTPYNQIVGYSVRNHYLKTAVDRVYNNFRYNKSEAYWSCVRKPYFSYDVLQHNSNTFRNYYVSPNVLNPLFDRQISLNESDPDKAYNEDHFKCMCFYDIKALRPMSELGLPPL